MKKVWVYVSFNISGCHHYLTFLVVSEACAPMGAVVSPDSCFVTTDSSTGVKNHNEHQGICYLSHSEVIDISGSRKSWRTNRYRSTYLYVLQGIHRLLLFPDIRFTLGSIHTWASVHASLLPCCRAGILM